MVSLTHQVEGLLYEAALQTGTCKTVVTNSQIWSLLSKSCLQIIHYKLTHPPVTHFVPQISELHNCVLPNHKHPKWMPKKTPRPVPSTKFITSLPSSTQRHLIPYLSSQTHYHAGHKNEQLIVLTSPHKHLAQLRVPHKVLYALSAHDYMHKDGIIACCKQ